MSTNRQQTRINASLTTQGSIATFESFPSPVDRRIRAGLEISTHSYSDLRKSLSQMKTPEQVVSHAYQVILGRKPDKHGLSNYIQLLEKSGLKALVCDLHFSPEGQAQAVKIRGLQLSYVYRKFLRILRRL